MYRLYRDVAMILASYIDNPRDWNAFVRINKVTARIGREQEAQKRREFREMINRNFVSDTKIKSNKLITDQTSRNKQNIDYNTEHMIKHIRTMLRFEQMKILKLLRGGTRKPFYYVRIERFSGSCNSDVVTKYLVSKIEKISGKAGIDLSHRKYETEKTLKYKHIWPHCIEMYNKYEEYKLMIVFDSKCINVRIMLVNTNVFDEWFRNVTLNSIRLDWQHKRYIIMKYKSEIFWYYFYYPVIKDIIVGEVFNYNSNYVTVYIK